MLTIAARHADIISVAGTYQVVGKPPVTFSYVTVHEPYREAFEPVVQRLRS